MQVVYWGTYDTGKPRNRIMIRGLREKGIQVVECNANVWKGIEDKSQLSGIIAKIRTFLSLLFSYPFLIYKYLRLPHHDVVVVGYMGQFDVLVIWPITRLRGIPICWDVFLSLYDTIVIDRKLVSKSSMVAFLLYALEWASSRAADQLILDTRTHAEYFEKLYRLRPHSIHYVYVGAETDIFKKKAIFQNYKEEVFKVLFYGQFIPLHGIDTIVYAAKLLEECDPDISWILIGKGQEQPRIDSLINRIGVKSICRISWVAYEELINYISEADVSLGIFAPSGKAMRVIPNKIYQILAAGRPLITADTPAIRELLCESPIIRMVDPGNPQALATAILDLRQALKEIADISEYSDMLIKIGYAEVGKQLLEALTSIRR
ncbi:MAG: glycosyltransferase [bacterium]